MRIWSVLRRWVSDPILLIVAAMAVITPMLRDQEVGPFPRRDLILELIGILLLCGVLLQVELAPETGKRLARFLARGVNAPLLALLAWAAVSVLWVAPVGPGHLFAVIELQRLALGVVLCMVVAHRVRNETQIWLLTGALMVTAALLTISPIFSPYASITGEALYRVEQLVGGLLSLFLPLLAALVLAAPQPRQRWRLGLLLFLVTVAFLLASTLRSRTAALAGLTLFAALALGYRPGLAGSLIANRRYLVGGSLALIGLVGLLLAPSSLYGRVAGRQAAAPVEQRKETERSVRDKQTLRMIARNPLFGLGLGNYVLQQHSVTGLGQPAPVVTQHGADPDEQAQNEYLQVAAELGLPGLLLYALVLVLFFTRSVHALDRFPPGGSQLLLIGCIAGIGAQCVDAAGSPAWRYSICSIYFWLVLGLGVALAQSAPRYAAVPASEPAHEEVSGERAVARV